MKANAKFLIFYLHVHHLACFPVKSFHPAHLGATCRKLISQINNYPVTLSGSFIRWLYLVTLTGDFIWWLYLVTNNPLTNNPLSNRARDFGYWYVFRQQRAHRHTHTHIHTQTLTYTHIRVHTQTLMYKHTHTHSYNTHTDLGLGRPAEPAALLGHLLQKERCHHHGCGLDR